MKYLKSFNESTDDQNYKQIFNTIEDCFLEFADKGWYWVNDTEHNNLKPPYFSYRMIERDDEYYDTSRKSTEYFDFCGWMESNGEIIWDSKDLTDDKFNDLTESPTLEDLEELIVAVKRVNQETGLDFRFAFNNKGGEKRIIIRGPGGSKSEFNKKSEFDFKQYTQ